MTTWSSTADAECLAHHAELAESDRALGRPLCGTGSANCIASSKGSRAAMSHWHFVICVRFAAQYRHCAGDLGCIVSTCNLLLTYVLISQSPELDVFFWVHDRFLCRGEAGPSHMTPVDQILSQVCLATINIRPQRVVEEHPEGDKQTVWITPGLNKVRRRSSLRPILYTECVQNFTTI